MRLLVIGGTDSIRPPLVRRLLEQGHEVAAFHRSRTRAGLPPEAQDVLGDRHRLEDHGAEDAILAEMRSEGHS